MMDFNKTERRVLICGAREWADQDRILRCVRKANERQKSKTATKTLEQTDTPNPISKHAINSL
jgi:hypothetical protein